MIELGRETTALAKAIRDLDRAIFRLRLALVLSGLLFWTFVLVLIVWLA